MPLSISSPISLFFRGMLARFEGGWRPDVFGNNVHESNAKLKLGPVSVTTPVSSSSFSSSNKGKIRVKKHHKGTPPLTLLVPIVPIPPSIRNGTHSQHTFTTTQQHLSIYISLPPLLTSPKKTPAYTPSLTPLTLLIHSLRPPLTPH